MHFLQPKMERFSVNVDGQKKPKAGVPSKKFVHSPFFVESEVQQGSDQNTSFVLNKIIIIIIIIIIMIKITTTTIVYSSMESGFVTENVEEVLVELDKEAPNERLECYFIIGL